jgi:hypothetical protein
MAALSSPPLPSTAPRSARRPAVAIESSERSHLLLRAADLDRQARESAEAGDLMAAGRLILQALDCERRAGGLGPQVLQLIKPR